MARINLLYATKVNLGGWATFTVHLYNLLKLEGHDVHLYKVGNRTEPFERPLADHGIMHRNYAAAHLPDLAAQNQYCIIAALGKHYVDAAQPLLAKGAGIVAHDTAESTNRMDINKPWVIRKTLAKLFDDATLIRHPYAPFSDLRREPTVHMKNRRGYVATSRVDLDKNTRMILDANRLGAGVDIVGFENRLYTRFKICPDHPEWVQSKGDHPRSGVASFDRLVKARGMVDLTDIKGDGGGTQYTFLEAWDAGAVPIIGSWWIQKLDDMKPMTNCFTVGSAEELTRLTKRWPVTARDLVEAGRLRLKKLHGRGLVPEILAWLKSVKGE